MLVSSTPTITPTTMNMANPKQIVAISTSNAVVVIYSVPTGKKFTGIICSGNNSYGSSCNITNAQGNTVSSMNTPTMSLNITPVTLVAGTTITNTGTYGTLVFGVETDA